MRLPFSSRGCALSLFHLTLRPSLCDLTTLPWRYSIYTSHGRHRQSVWHCNSTFTSSFGEGNSLQVNGRLQLYFYSGEQCRRTAASRIQFSIPPARSHRGSASSGASADRGLSRVHVLFFPTFFPRFSPVSWPVVRFLRPKKVRRIVANFPSDLNDFEFCGRSAKASRIAAPVVLWPLVCTPPRP